MGGAEIGVDDVCSHVAKHLAKHKVPKVVVFDETLPREDTKVVQTSAQRALLAGQDGFLSKAR
jgi:long-chain acyl-CoA synthetase